MFPHNKQFGFNERFHRTRFALVDSWLISAFRAKLKIGAARLDRVWDQAVIFFFGIFSTIDVTDVLCTVSD